MGYPYIHFVVFQESAHCKTVEEEAIFWKSSLTPKQKQFLDAGAGWQSIPDRYSLLQKQLHEANHKRCLEPGSTGKLRNKEEQLAPVDAASDTKETVQN